jgi:hypothetical protein
VIMLPRFDFPSLPPPVIVLLDSGVGGILQILSEMSWDTLFLLVGLAFVAVAVLGNISGKISPGKQGRIAAGIIGACLFAGGIWYHVTMHGFKVTASMVSTPGGPLTGTCPFAVNLQGIVDASGSGDVIYDFEFSNGNASDLSRVTFQKTDSQIVTGVWEVQKSLTNAWVQLNIAAPQTRTSQPSGKFSVTCVPRQTSGTPPPQTNATSPASAPAVAAPPAAAAATAGVSAHEVNNSTDSVALTSVQPPPGTYLKTGQPVPFNINVSYNMVSADSAILSISTVQVRTSTANCSGGGELVDAVEVPITRGRHQIVTQLTWSGDTGSATRGRIYGSGYLSFSPMFWASNNGARSARLDYFGTYAEYCYQFGK